MKMIVDNDIKKSELGKAIPAMDSIVLSGKLTDSHLKTLEGLVNELSEQFGRTSGFSNLLASIAKQRGQRDKAIQIYESIISSEPNNIVALNNLAVALSEDDLQLGKAAELSDRTIKLAGRIPALLDTRAVIAIAAGDVEKGLELLEEADRSDRTGHAIFLFHRAFAQLELGNKDEAIKLFRRATEKKLTSDSLGSREVGWFRRLMKTG